MTDKMRSDFEAEILKNRAAFMITKVASGEYQSGTTQELWKYWQAATLVERERCMTEKMQSDFEAWYLSEIGITYQDAVARGVHDLELLKRCWRAATLTEAKRLQKNFNQNIWFIPMFLN